MIEVRDLTRRFGDLTAVDGLSFGVERGELFGLLGPDGSGKTTTLRMLAGVLRPTSGDAVVDGVSVAEEPERVKDRIAYMAQRFDRLALLYQGRALALDRPEELERSAEAEEGEERASLEQAFVQRIRAAEEGNAEAPRPNGKEEWS